MKRIIASILIVMTLCFSFSFNCYATDPGVENQIANQENEQNNKSPQENQDQPPEVSPAPPAPSTPPTSTNNDDVSVPTDNGTMTMLAIIWCVLVFLLVVAILVFVLVRTAALNKTLKSIKKSLSNDEQEKRLTQKLDLIENELMMVKGKLNTLDSNIANSVPVAASQPVEPAVPVVELTFEEKINNALNSGNMAEFGMEAVDIKDNNGVIEVTECNGSNILYYRKREADGSESIYPDSKIKDMAWKSRYDAWFNINRSSVGATIITLNNPLVIKHNPLSGRYDVMSKGNVTIF